MILSGMILNGGPIFFAIYNVMPYKEIIENVKTISLVRSKT